MMLFGICTGFTKKEGTFAVPHVDFIKHCGFDYVEFSLHSIAALTEDEFGRFEDFAKGMDVPCLVCNVFMDGGIPMTGAKLNPAAFEAYVEKAVARAAAIGVKKLVLGSGGSRNVPSGFPMEQAEKQFSDCLDFMIAQVKLHGIQLELEHLNRLESNIITSFCESARMAEEKNDPCFKSILDYFHFAVGGEPLTLILEHAKAIGHIHFARPLGRVYPELSDMPSLQGVLKTIKSSGYNQTFSMECTFPKMEEEPEEYKEVLDVFKKAFL